MSATMKKKAISVSRLLSAAAVAAMLVCGTPSHAAAPGITSTGGTAATFNLQAHDGYINQPDGNQVYTWGYGCNDTGTPTFAPAAISPGAVGCPNMQIPAPTLIVTEGQPVTVKLTNNLPAGAGNTSILFPGFNVNTSCSASTPVGVQGLLTCEAAPGGGTVTYTFTASSPGTRAYYSGTQGDLQIEMGLYGAIIVLPKPSSVPANCDGPLPKQNLAAKQSWSESDFRLAHAAYDHPRTCYDREYLFQWSEMDLNIHKAAQAQVAAIANNIATGGCAVKTNGVSGVGCTLEVPTEPYHPGYFLINGRSMPDLMDPNYDTPYPHQPYNGNPHMHPGEQVLLRVIGQGRWQHPFHEHANHVRILARDGNLVLTPDGQALAGLLMFNTDTTPGQAFDGIFYFTGRGLNWDMFGHNPTSSDPLAKLPCTADAYGYNTGFPATDTNYSTTPNALVAQAVNYYEWCQDHNKPVEANPFGDVPSGGPATLPNPNIFTNGAWYGGTPYFGPDAALRAMTTLRNDNNPNGQGCVTQGVNSGVGGVLGIAIANGGTAYSGTLTVTISNGGGTGATATATADPTTGAITAISIVNEGSGYTSQPTVSITGSTGGTGFVPGTVSVQPVIAGGGATPNCTNLQPANTQANPANERGWAFMWHSHNEREITTNNVFPGGMLMMMLVDSREFVIDESQ